MQQPDETRTLGRIARVTGALYLLIFASAGFAEGFVRDRLVVAGDAAVTAGNILGSATLFRVGIFADLIAFLADAVVTVLLYVLLRPAGETLALLAAAFRLVAHPAIAALNLLNQFAALRLLEGVGSFEISQREGLALLAMELHGAGYVLAGAFFGVHLALLALLVRRSRLLPGILGLLLALSAFGYLFESVATFVLPQLLSVATPVVVVTAGIGELCLCLYLLIRGVRAPV